MALLGLLASSSAQPARGQGSEGHNGQYRYRAVFVETPPTVDGDLSDPVWQQAEVIDQLTQQEPDFGAPPTEKTEVRLVYDSTALYIAAYCYDSDPAGVVRNILRFRDDQVWTKDDVIRFALDTFHDHRRAYIFSINPLGTKQDTQVDNNTWNSSWDEVWDVRTRLQDDGWSLELRIPFRILRFPPGGGGVWGFNFERVIKRKNESSLWVPIPPGFFLSRTEYYGHLEGISVSEARRNIQIIPYGLLGGARSKGVSGADSTMEGGVDLKMSVASSLSLDLTYNPSFAQVEADDEQVNLTRFSLFFPEKREFFLENAPLFNFGLVRDTQLFFSRRIGLVSGEAVPILGGARLSGKAGAFDVGLLTTQTENHPKAPSTNLSTGRLRWNMGERSYIGGIFTSASSDAQSNRAFGPDALIWLSRNLRAEGFLAVVDDRELDERPVSFSGALTYDEDLWEASFRTLSVEEDFNPALGFVRRDNIRRHTGRLRRSWRLNRKWVRKVNFSADLTYLTDQQDRLDTRQWKFEASDELDSGDQIRFLVSRNFERILADDDPFVINPRRGIVISPGDYGFNRWLVQYQGFEGRALVPGVKFARGEFYGGEQTTLGLSGTWRASPHLVLRGDYEYNDISLPQGAFATHLWRARFSVPITARATVDAFFQWNGLTQQGDKEINTQLRFHLIYARDSNLFVVFTDQRRNRGAGIIERDQAIQMKMTYRLYW
ncbi:MAG: carbohydrate binding family 9 domain-containing protein [Acidobacteria bacterium]|nr:carbohydrate binding family 9 domain-containing protein [Acidobacteriota bacterium]